MIRILFVFLELSTGGTEKRMLSVIQSLDRRRFEPEILLLSQASVARQGLTTVPIHVVRWRSLKSPLCPFMLYAIRKTVKALDPHIVVTAFTRDTMIMNLSTTGICTAHVVLRVNMSNDLSNGTYYFFWRFLRPKIAAFIANSSATADRTSEVYGPVLKDMRCITRVIPNGVDTDYYRPPTSEERRQARLDLGVLDNEMCLLSVANLKPLKRVDWTIRAVSRLTRKTPVRLWVLGDGTERGRLQELAKKLGIQASVQFLGIRKDVRPVIWAADAGVLCSTSEGCSNAILEQMACGVPMVASAVGGNVELLENGRGLLFRAEDFDGLSSSLETLTANKGLRKTVAGAALSYVREHHGHPCMVSHYERAFEKLAAKAACPG